MGEISVIIHKRKEYYPGGRKMKKITVFIFLILMSCATCGAFNPPNPERWELLKTTGSILCYFNRDSVQMTE